MQFSANYVEKFVARTAVLKESAGKCRCSSDWILFLYSAYLHAHMWSLDYNRNPERIQVILNAIPDLNGEAFLQLQATGKGLHDARNLAQTR